MSAALSVVCPPEKVHERRMSALYYKLGVGLFILMSLTLHNIMAEVIANEAIHLLAELEIEFSCQANVLSSI